MFACDHEIRNVVPAGDKKQDLLVEAVVRKKLISHEQGQRHDVLTYYSS